MKSFYRLFTLLFFSLVIASCTSTKTAVEPKTSEEEVNVEEELTPQLTEDWYLTPSNYQPYYGTGVEKAYRELLADKAPKEKVIVAIIDSGTDIEHEDLKGNIWVNEDEVPGNGIDDDDNGYVDDIYGWNFIGGPDSTHVAKDTYELTRLYVELKDSPEDSTRFKEIEEAYKKRYASNEQQLNQLEQNRQAIQFAVETLEITNLDSVEITDMQPKEDDSQSELQAKQIVNYLLTNEAKQSDLDQLEEYYEYLIGIKEYGLNPEFDPRDIVGDDYNDLSNRYYGNNDVIGPDASHGTHVAGIVGAIRDNGLGAQGIANNVELMIIRTVPDGDERDKDVANAIRYAAENGARVINMSFGKGYSPEKTYVDEAMKYAESVGALLITGSGNGSDNVDSTNSYPSKYYEDGQVALNYLNVGATSWQNESNLVASFSNYGNETVDIFAPGVDIYSTIPGNEYKYESGTSMASPVVAGISALIMSYYPELTTKQVKDIIMETVTIPVVNTVFKPGTEQSFPFAELSVSDGIINAYEALKLAEERSKK